MNTWGKLVKKMIELDPDTITIKDMNGILRPYVAYDLIKMIKRLGAKVDVHSYATAGLAPFTFIKSVEARSRSIRHRSFFDILVYELHTG